MAEDVTIDPWSANQSTDYSRIIEQFGLSTVDLSAIPNPHMLHRRGIIFSHRDLDLVLGAHRVGDPFGVLTGLMPSGRMHLGHKMVIDQVKWFQEHGADVTIAVADLEAHATRGLSLEECRTTALGEYVANYAALGLDVENTSIYFQSTRPVVQRLGFTLGKRTNLSEFEAIYEIDVTGLAPQIALPGKVPNNVQSIDDLELENFLDSHGWRPKIDTLSKIAVYNEWVKKKYIKKNDYLFPFSIFILRQHAKDNLIINSIKKFINKNGYKILNYNSLTGNIRKNVTVNLRGGNWKDHQFLDKTKKFEPSYAMIVYNLDSFENNKFVNLKEKIRKKFDNTSDPSVVHSTDNENDFWDYLEFCFPKKIDFFKKKILKMNKKKVSLSIFKKIDIWIYKIKHSSISLIKKEIIKLISIK